MGKPHRVNDFNRDRDADPIGETMQPRAQRPSIMTISATRRAIHTRRIPRPGWSPSPAVSVAFATMFTQQRVRGTRTISRFKPLIGAGAIETTKVWCRGPLLAN